VVNTAAPGGAPKRSSPVRLPGWRDRKAFAEAGHIVVSNSRNTAWSQRFPFIPDVNPDHLKLLDASRRRYRLEGLDHHQSELLNGGARNGARRCASSA
jgi:hypothetical protein